MSTELNTYIDALKLDKSSWEKVKFGDVAIQQKESVDRDNNSLTRYVKGEHMVSEDLHIREWGDLKDEYLGPAFIRKFSKGDILYGSRRTYLRKVAIADFDGITSNTTFVIKANPKKIDERLLPFIMLSEGFAEHSIKNSKGSVNPYINWKDIANYQFLLPPKDQQARLASLLWALDEVMEREREVLEGLERTKFLLLNFAFNKNTCRKVILKDIAKSLDNRRIPIRSSDRIYGPYPYYGASGVVDFIDKYIFDEPILLISEDGENLLSRKLPIAYSVDEKCWVNNHAHVLQITNESRYLVKEFFNFTNVADYVTGGTRPKITKGMLMEIPIYLPDEMNSSSIEKKLILSDTSIKKAKEKIASSNKLQKSLINQIF